VTQQAGLAGKTFPVANDAFVLIDGKPGKLAGIPKGTGLDLGLSADQKAILRIEARGSRIGGVVQATDAEKSTVTVAVAAEGDRTLTVAKDTTLEIDGKPAKLTELPRGAHITLVLAVDQTARNLRAEGSPVSGVVRAVDFDKKTITVEDKEGEKTFPVAQDAHVEVDGKPATLAGLPRGANANLTLGVDEKTVRNVRAEGSQVIGAYVRAVDAEKRTITLEARELDRLAEVDGKTFTVAADARVEIDGKPGQLAEVPVGALVDLGVSADQMTARSVQARGSCVGGFGTAVVKSVDAEKNTITLEINQEGDKTFAVAKDAAIEIDGKPGKLTDLPKGATVSLSLRTDQKTAGRIEAKRP
jgi:Cu/Ag efflux protein CusF